VDDVVDQEREFISMQKTVLGDTDGDNQDKDTIHDYDYFWVCVILLVCIVLLFCLFLTDSAWCIGVLVFPTRSNGARTAATSPRELRSHMFIHKYNTTSKIEHVCLLLKERTANRKEPQTHYARLVCWCACCCWCVSCCCWCVSSLWCASL